MRLRQGERCEALYDGQPCREWADYLCRQCGRWLCYFHALAAIRQCAYGPCVPNNDLVESRRKTLTG